MKNFIKTFMIANIIGLSLFSSGCSDSKIEASYTQSQIQKENPSVNFIKVSADEAKNMIEKEKEKDYIILDVRTPEEYKDKHIKNAINFPLDTINSDTAKNMLKNKNQKIFVYCRTGRRSQIAAEQLSLLGYNNIVDFGGIIYWKGDISNL